ncbi:MAG: DNA-protecting protein DprA [Gemmatimonadales bacterium]|nr:DNA-protecting protein DprA [Gemmatimonadales bacterium]
MDDERAAWLALAMVPGIGPVRLQTLLATCHTPLGAHSAPFEFLCTLPGFSRAAASAVKQTTPLAGRTLLEQAERHGARVFASFDPDFPELLRHIPDPPPVLFARGNLELLSRPAAAVVGSRDHSAYGASVCRMVAAESADAGVVVVSGMARGLDAVAHGAALDAAGGTIGVLGNGLGVVYPAANRGLYQRVVEHGLLLTEFPPGERPHAGSFPRRNRIISGLARATVVIEAAAGSGALITAGAALEQGREVLAVPGPITSPSSVGCNRLIRDGATPLLETADLLQLYPEVERPLPRAPVELPSDRRLPETLSPEEREVAVLIGNEVVALDDLAARAGLRVEKLLAVLCGLEIAGVVEQRAGRNFCRV